MSDIPPKHSPDTPYNPAEVGGGLVAMYNAASHANAESFPVLKAFQDYIEAERAQARKRVMQLSVFFAVLMGVVVTGFLTAGIFMLRNMSDVQTKLLDVALAAKEAPAQQQPMVVHAPAVQVQPAPLPDESVRLITKATSDLQSSLDKKMDGVSDLTAKVHERVAARDGEMGKLREELQKMQEQNARLNAEWVTLKTEGHPTAPVAAPLPAPAVRPPPSPAAAAPQPVAVGAVPAPVKAFADPRFPPAVKEPPVTPDGVTPPPVPPGRLATAMPLKTKNAGTIPWRVLIPD
jgi:hypothetical protein